MTPAEALKLAEKNGAKMVDFKFVDLLGIWQHTTMPIGEARGRHVQGRLLLRRQLDPRLAADPRLRHDLHPRSELGGHGSVPDHADAVADLRHRRRDHQAALPEGSAHDRRQGRGVPEVDRHRRHVVLRSRARVLRLRRGPLLGRPEPLQLHGRLDRRPLEHGPRQRDRTSATSRRTRVATSRCRRPTR